MHYETRLFPKNICILQKSKFRQWMRHNEVADQAICIILSVITLLQTAGSVVTIAGVTPGSLFTWYTGCCWLTTDIRKLIQLYQDKLTTAQDGKTVILAREPIIDLFLGYEIYFEAQCSNSPFSCYSMRQARWPLGLTELSSSQNRYILPSQRILDTDLTLTTSLVRSWPCCCPPVPCADFDQLYQFFLHFWSDIFVVFHFSNIH